MSSLQGKWTEPQERQNFYITLDLILSCMRNISVKWDIKKERKKSSSYLIAIPSIADA